MTSANTVRPSAGCQWRVCAASVVGREHRRRGLSCDDAFSFGVVEDFVVAAVADGAGSVTGTSAWGAHIACQVVLDVASQPEFIDTYRKGGPQEVKGLMSGLFESALQGVTRQAASMTLEPDFLATTLCVGVADSRHAVFGQIGDGVVVAERHGRIETLLIEQKFGYANTTTFLQSEGALEHHLRISQRSGVQAFGLSTDGMAYKITDIASGQAYEPFFRDSWQHVRAGASAEKLGDLLRGIEDDQTGDDKTMVLVAAGQDGAEVPAMSKGAAVTGHSAPPSEGATGVIPIQITSALRHRALPRSAR